MSEETELAWSAGFFDGEGCTYLSSDRYVTVKIGQCVVENLIRFREAVGLGNIIGPYKRGPNQQPIWYYNVQSLDAVRVIELLWPYLGSAKKQQFERVKSQARTAHRKGFCRKNRHRMVPGNITKEGRCLICRILSK